MRGSRTWKAVAALAGLAVLAAGCGDDDDEAGGDSDAFCEVAREMDEQENFPGVEQLQRYRDNAPDEIREEADLVANAFIEATEAGDPFAAMEEPGVEEALEGVLEPFEASECGLELEDGDEDGENAGEENAEEDPTVTSLDPAAARVDVVATDYEFAFTPPGAGRTSFVMSNQGAERHVMLLFRLAEGFTFDEVLESDGDEGLEDDWVSDTAVAGEEAVLTVDLEPGEYGMICFLPTAEGEEHADLGMKTSFTVA